jgi:hypothetical protein
VGSTSAYVDSRNGVLQSLPRFSTAEHRSSTAVLGLITCGLRVSVHTSILDNMITRGAFSGKGGLDLMVVGQRIRDIVGIVRDCRAREPGTAGRNGKLHGAEKNDLL